MNSTTGHGTVEVELQFDHDATEEDVLAVARRLDEIVLGNVTVLSRSVRLGKPSLNVQLR